MSLVELMGWECRGGPAPAMLLMGAGEAGWPRIFLCCVPPHPTSSLYTDTPITLGCRCVFSKGLYMCFRAGEACLPTEIFENTDLASVPYPGPREACLTCYTLLTARICSTVCTLVPELATVSMTLCGHCPDTLWASRLGPCP